MKFQVILFSVLLFGFSSLGIAQTYETCSLNVWDLLKIADYYEGKAPLASIVTEPSASHNENAKRLYSIAEKEGLGEARLSALGTYTFCMKDAHSEFKKSVFSNNKPPFYECGRANAVNFQILAALHDGKTAEKLKNELPEELYEKIDLFSDYADKFSVDYAITQAAKSVSDCIEKVQNENK